MGGFALVSLSSGVTGIALAPNLFNLAVSVLGGLPGVVTLLFLRLIWQT